MTENDELLEGEHHAFTVGKISLGTVYDVPLSEHLKLGLGGLYAVNFVPDALEPLYGGDEDGAMAFLRLKIE
jgi:hypothetical protein